MEQLPLKYDDLCRLLDALGVGAVVVSPECRILAINRSAGQLAGVSAAGSVGEDCRRLRQVPAHVYGVMRKAEQSAIRIRSFRNALTLKYGPGRRDNIRHRNIEPHFHQAIFGSRSMP